MGLSGPLLWKFFRKDKSLVDKYATGDDDDGGKAKSRWKKAFAGSRANVILKMSAAPAESPTEDRKPGGLLGLLRKATVGQVGAGGEDAESTDSEAADSVKSSSSSSSDSRCGLEE